MWGKGYPPLSGIYTFLQKVSVSLFSIRRNFHRMWRRLFFCPNKKPDDYINVTIELDDVDITSAETKSTYDEIKKPIGILQGKSLPKILRQNKYVMNQVLTKRKNS